MSRVRTLRGLTQKPPESSSGGRPAFFVTSHFDPSRTLSRLSLLAVLLLGIAGCESVDTGVIDPSGQPPFLASTRIVPDTVDLRTIPPSGDRYAVSIVVRAEITRLEVSSSPLSVSAAVIPPQPGFPTLEIGLQDDGLAPDSVSGDGSYSGTLSFEVTATQAGFYRIRVTARSAEGFESITRERLLPITRNNARPVLSDLVAPDTVNAPTTERLLIVMSVRADDPDGADDVREVYFRSLDSSDPTKKFFMKDDGNLSESGDRVAGDGVFSIIVELLPGTPSRTFRFAFQAEDSFRDTSDTLLHYLTVR